MTTTYVTKPDATARLALRNAILLVAKAILMAGCASAPPTIVHETVGPALAAGNEERNGFLTVYSATAWMTDDDGPRLLRHTDYDIDAADGILFKQVSNLDEEPTRIILPKGDYTIVAQSDTFGTVRVPVAIDAGKLTVLHLEGEKDWEEASAGIRRTELVRLPNGQPIGVRARTADCWKVHSWRLHNLNKIAFGNITVRSR